MSSALLSIADPAKKGKKGKAAKAKAKAKAAGSAPGGGWRPEDFVLDEAQLRDNDYPLAAALADAPTDGVALFVATQPMPAGMTLAPARRVLALDCEMVLSNHGHELARVSVVDFNGAVVYETFVKPQAGAGGRSRVSLFFSARARMCMGWASLLSPASFRF